MQGECLLRGVRVCVDRHVGGLTEIYTLGMFESLFWRISPGSPLASHLAPVCSRASLSQHGI